MAPGPLQSVGVKEIRALFPVWLACTVTVGAVAIDPYGGWILGIPGALAYGVGSITLGALSMGHDYTHGTLGPFPSQLSDRRRLFLMKLAVLATMLLMLNLVAWGVSFRLQHRGVTGDELSVLFMVALCGLFVAPCLTMLSRSWLAGVVLTIGIPASLFSLGLVLAAAKSGFITPEMERLNRAVFWRVMLAVCAVAAVLSWRTFMRLEADEASPRRQDA